MSVEDLATDWITIPFPSPLDRERLEALFLYVAQQLPGDVTYIVEEHKRVSAVELGAIGSESLSMKVSTSIRENYPPYRSASFTCQSDDDPLFFSSLQFQPVPGYTQQEHSNLSSASTDVLNRVRELVNYYFK